MTTRADHHEQHSRDQGEVEHGVYVYGILDASVSLPEDLPSVGDDDTAVRLASHGQLAALISDLPLTRPLGTRADLLEHDRVLDTLAAEATVLPMRFGAVVSDADAVIDELLAPHHDHFMSVLSELAGLVEFTVRGRYVEGAHLREVVAEEPEVRQLREALQGVPEDAGYDQRVRLGELVNHAVANKREADAAVLAEALAPSVVASTRHDAGGEDDAVAMALLVDRGWIPQFEQAVEDIGQQWIGRIQLRLIGPVAPYDFIPEA